MATELEVLASLTRLRATLKSGHALEIVERSDATQADVARVIRVSPASVSRYLNASRSPRRAVALRLLRLLDSLEVLDRAS